MSVENRLRAFRNSKHLRDIPIWDNVREIYEAGLKIATFNRGLTREIYPGLFFNCSYLSRHAIPADVGVNNYDLPSLEYIRSQLANHPGTCYIDCGANQGQYVMVVDRWIGAGGRVFAFEPHAPTVKVLEENINRNNCQSVEIVPLALGDAVGTHSLYGSQGLGTTFTLFDEVVDKSSLGTVNVTTLDSFCLENDVQPLCIKIDVEGFELSVLKGASSILSQLKDSLKIVCEMHTFMWRDPDYDLQILEYLQKLGLRVFTLAGEEVGRIREYGHYIIARTF
jgi:FkbM family methyltransferase